MIKHFFTKVTLYIVPWVRGLIFLYIFIFSTSLFAQTNSDQINIDTLEKKLQLKEVTIVAKKKLFERKTDRLVFNVENSILATGGDITDALRITPGLQIKNDQITMIGKSGMIVMIDDRVLPLNGENLMNYLKTLPTANIKSIEVISIPPAKYDAAGNSGIVNIILKKTKNDSWNLTLRNTYTQRIYASGNGGVDFNYKKDKLSIYSSLNYGISKTKTINNNTIYYPDEKWSTFAPFDVKNNNLNENLGIDYEINSKWKIGAFYLGNISDSEINNQLTTSVFQLDNSLSKYINSTGNDISKPNMNSFNLHSVNVLDTLGRKVSIDFDYLFYNNKDTAYYSGENLFADKNVIPNSYFAKISNNIGGVKNYSAKIDIEFPCKWMFLNFGTKLSFSQTNNDYKAYDNSTGNQILDSNQSNEYDYKEDVQAIYISGRKQINNNMGLQLGLRLENTITEGYSKTLNQTNSKSYLQLFPTFYFMYKLKNDNTLSLSYSRRINRPYFDQLNPFKIYLSSLSYVEGNPFLQPSFSNNVELVLNTDMFEHKLWYSINSDDFQQFPFIDATTKTTRYYPSNFMNYYSVGISESVTFNKLWWWNSYNNAVCYYIRKTSTIAEAQPMIEKVSGNITTNNDFMLNKNKTFMLNIGYYFELPYIDGFANIEAMGQLYGGVKLLLLDKNLQLSLTANDILKTQRAKATIISNNINNIYNNYNDNQYIRLSISYKFGNKKLQPEQRDAGNEEERNRIKK